MVGGGPCGAAVRRTLGVFALGSLIGWATAAAQDREIEDRVEVRLAAIELRAADAQGEPLSVLDPNALRVSLDGERVPIESIEIVRAGADVAPSTTAPSTPPPTSAVPERVGQSIVVLVQSSLEPMRLSGHRVVRPHLDRLLAGLGPDDQVAVFGFAASLTLEHDSSTDRTATTKAIARAMRLTPAAPNAVPATGRIGRRIDPAALGSVATPEAALEQVGLALVGEDQPTVVLFVGWGLGRFGADGVRRTPGWARAEAALARVGAPLLVLDVSQSDYHSLEVGLFDGAEATGGSYTSARDFPSVAVRRLEAALASRIRVWVRVPEGTRDDAKVEVRLDGSVGRVLGFRRRLGD